MSAIYKKPYVESSVFIAFIKGEKNQGPAHDQDAKEIMDSIIDAAKAGLFPLVTSSLTIAEVFKKKNSVPLTVHENEDLRPYFREDYIQIVEVDRDIGDRANELCRTLQADNTAKIKALRPNDAIHIASAERAGCDVILAWDRDFTGQSSRLTSIKLENPQRVEFRPVPSQQPMQFQNGEHSESEIQSEQPATEEDNQLKAPAAHPIALPGSNGGRSEGETPSKEENIEEIAKSATLPLAIPASSKEPAPPTEIEKKTL